MEPPVAKYKYTLTITGNSHAEIQHELLVGLRIKLDPSGAVTGWPQTPTADATRAT